MEGSLKIDFKDEDSFTIFYITKDNFETEEEYKVLFKYLNNELIKRYNCSFSGLYDVFIYVNKDLYILDFDYIDDFSSRDFNVTIFLNSNILYEFYDSDLITSEKIYYKGKYYTEIDNMLDDIRLFEYGNIIFGKEVEEILNKGILIS